MNTGKNEAISTIIRNEIIHFYKKVKLNNRSRYKKVEYLYDILGKDGEIVDTKRHNALNKPALIIYIGTKVVKLEYWYKGERHRNWAPAIIELDGKEIVFESWYQNGTKLNDKEIEQIKKTLSRRRKVLKLMIKGIQRKKGAI
jgi:hypothetical protein